MKKQLLFLFAASALFAACSSDDMPTGSDVNNGQEQTDVTEYASSLSVATADGVGMSIGTLDDAAATRAEYNAGSNYYFDLELYQGDVLEQWDEYIVKADDFAIRYNGEYQTVEKTGDEDMPTGAEWQNLRITRDRGKFKVRIEQLDEISWFDPEEDPIDVTFEAYIWVENKKLLDDGTGGYGELFTWNDKVTWVGGNAANDGVDISKLCTAGESIFDGRSNNEEIPGFEVRYNVYRGLSGRQTDQDGNYDKNDGLGDTPYIKVAIHVTNRGDEKPTEVRAIYPSEEAAE